MAFRLGAAIYGVLYVLLVVRGLVRRSADGDSKVITAIEVGGYSLGTLVVGAYVVGAPQAKLWLICGISALAASLVGARYDYLGLLRSPDGRVTVRSSRRFSIIAAVLTTVLTWPALWMSFRLAFGA